MRFDHLAFPFWGRFWKKMVLVVEQGSSKMNQKSRRVRKKRLEKPRTDRKEASRFATLRRWRMIWLVLQTWNFEKTSIFYATKFTPFQSAGTLRAVVHAPHWPDVESVTLRGEFLRIYISGRYKIPRHGYVIVGHGTVEGNTKYRVVSMVVVHKLSLPFCGAEFYWWDACTEMKLLAPMTDCHLLHIYNTHVAVIASPGKWNKCKIELPAYFDTKSKSLQKKRMRWKLQCKIFSIKTGGKHRSRFLKESLVTNSVPGTHVPNSSYSCVPWFSWILRFKNKNDGKDVNS